MARLLKSNGEIVSDLDVSTPEELRHYVNGYFEFLYTREQKMLIVNADGYLKKLPHNHLASILFENRIVGDVIEFDEQEFINKFE